jgi:hypothetical protein
MLVLKIAHTNSGQSEDILEQYIEHSHPGNFEILSAEIPQDFGALGST